MNSQDADKLLEQNLSGDPPSPASRARVLRDSTAAFVHTRWSGACWRLIALGTAAVLIAAVSFLLGRGSAPPSVPRSMAGPAIAGAAETVAVPSELVVWLDAARLFKQLGMADRMGRALDRAGRLLPRDAITAGSAKEPVFAAGGEAIDGQSKHVSRSRRPDLRLRAESVNRIVAQSLGDFSYANGMD